MPPDFQHEFLTTVEAARLLRISERSLEGMRLDETGPPYFKVGPSKRARVIYKRTDLLAWLDKHGRRPGGG